MEPAVAVTGPLRPSRTSLAIIVLLVLASATMATVGWVIATEARKPIGEGALFHDEIGRIVSAGPLGSIRGIRNDLGVEAVSVVDRAGVVIESTSQPLEGAVIRNALLLRAVPTSESPGSFAAVAAPLGSPIAIDGVPTWAADEILYQVAHPLDSERSLLISYDISELFSRRSAGRAIPQLALDLLLGAGTVALAAVGIVMVRSRAVRAHEVLSTESRLLRKQGETLKRHNRELETAKRRAEQALELAEEKNRIRAEFVLMINHELRTPLTGVVTGIEVVRELLEIDHAAAKALLDDIAADASRLEQMLSQMLVVARVENRGLFVEQVPVGLGATLDRVASGRTKPTVEIGGGLGPDDMLLSDATTLPMLVDSLVANAHTHGAGRVVVRASSVLPFVPMHEVGVRPDDALFLVVADDGPGIEPGFLPRAFEKFEKRSFGSGTGLGLYMARMMVEALGGSISVVTSSRGTAMAVGLPRAEQPKLVAS